MIESRVTHTKKSRSAFDGYRRDSQWPETCGEVAKLRVARRVRVTGRVTNIGTNLNLEGNKVEAAGVEPASGNASGQASTRVGTPFEVSCSPAAAGLRARQAN